MLTDLKYVAKLPQKIKTKEEGRVNPAYMNISDVGHFNPVAGVTYIWALNSEKKIIIGIQKPWEHPDAFNFDLKDSNQKKQWDDITDKLKMDSEDPSSLNSNPEGFGHPTIGAEFITEGERSGGVHPGACYLGGELNYKNEQWVINNKSGRYGRKKELGLDNQKEIQHILLEVADEFQRMGIPVKPELILNDPDPQFESAILTVGKKKEAKELCDEFKSRIMSQREETSSASSSVSDSGPIKLLPS